MKGISSTLTPAKVKINVKNSVDKPTMIATVPIKEKRSFHRFTKLSPIIVCKNSGLYPLLFR